MSGLNEHFKQSSYTFHRTVIRRERLPLCCRENLNSTAVGINYFSSDGTEIILPLMECSVCGRKFAISGEKYIAVDNILKFDIVNLE